MSNWGGKLLGFALVELLVVIAIIGILIALLLTAVQAGVKSFRVCSVPTISSNLVWLGPLRGGIAGGVGAYTSGIIAYGGWPLPDIIMNLIAGSLANATLPALLFRLFKIAPRFGTTPEHMKAGLIYLTLA